MVDPAYAAPSTSLERSAATASDSILLASQHSFPSGLPARDGRRTAGHHPKDVDFPILGPQSTLRDEQ